MAKVAKQQHNLINVVMDGSASINHQKNYRKRVDQIEADENN